MIYDKNCPFCNKPAEIAYNTYWKAIYDEFPVSPGHTLIVSQAHVFSWFDLSHDVQESALELINLVKEILDEKFHPDGYNIGINVGEAAGQSVPHCHIHIIPRYNGDVENPRGGVRGVIPSKQNY